MEIRLKRRAILGITGAAMALVVFSGSAFAATLFANGGFEGTLVPTFAGSEIQRLGTADTLPSWVVTEDTVDWVGNSYWQAAEGTKSIDLDGEVGDAGAISQTFPTTVGQTYAVTFKMSGNPDAGPALKTFTVSATGGVPVSYSYDTALMGTTRTNMNYVDASAYTFVATEPISTLTFASTTNPAGFGAVIDNVVVTETLKTGADCKKGGWQAMVDKNGVSFKNQGDCVSYYATGEKNLAN
jgi:choice-of-anchor C domain-containing protein